jgi:hypothetical protein
MRNRQIKKASLRIVKKGLHTLIVAPVVVHAVGEHATLIEVADEDTAPLLLLRRRLAREIGGRG